MYDNSNIAWSANQLTKMIGNGKIVFDLLVQRGLAWDKSRKSMLIHSMIIGVPIPATYARRSVEKDDNGNDVKLYSLIDGKQRLTTISAFMNDEFVLYDLPEITYYDEVENKDVEIDVNGMCFSDLPEDIQERIRNVRVNVIYFDDLSDTEVRELFKRLNNGKPLSPKSRSLASCENLEEVLEIGNHEVFTEMLSEKALANKNQAILVVKSWLMGFYELNDISFESKILNEIIENIEMTSEEKKIMNKVYDLIQDVHTALVDKGEKKIAKKLYTETHFISLIPFFKDAIERETISAEDVMSEWLISFYNDEWESKATSVSKVYNEVCASGANKNSAILKRNEELQKSYNRFFEVEDADEETEVEVEPETEEEANDIEEVEDTTETTEDVDTEEFENKTESEDEDVVDEDTQDVEEYDGDPDMSNLIDDLMGEQDSVKISDFWGD